MAGIKGVKSTLIIREWIPQNTVVAAKCWCYCCSSPQAKHLQIIPRISRVRVEQGHCCPLMRTPSRGGEEILGIKWNSSSVVHVLCDAAVASCIVDIIEFPPSVISVTTICWHRSRRRRRRRARRQPKPGFFLPSCGNQTAVFVWLPLLIWYYTEETEEVKRVEET